MCLVHQGTSRFTGQGILCQLTVRNRRISHLDVTGPLLVELGDPICLSVRGGSFMGGGRRGTFFHEYPAVLRHPASPLFSISSFPGQMRVLITLGDWQYHRPTYHPV